MENWGLITFRETSVLYDPDFSSISNHLAVTLTLTHELAHMWFGDLGKCLMPVEWQTQVNVERGVYLKLQLRTGTYSHYRIWQYLFNLKKANLLVGTEESGRIQGLPPEHFKSIVL